MITSKDKYFKKLDREERYLLFMGAEYIARGIMLRKLEYSENATAVQKVIMARWEKCYRLATWTIY